MSAAGRVRRAFRRTTSARKFGALRKYKAPCGRIRSAVHSLRTSSRCVSGIDSAERYPPHAQPSSRLGERGSRCSRVVPVPTPTCRRVTVICGPQLVGWDSAFQGESWPWSSNRRHPPVETQPNRPGRYCCKNREAKMKPSCGPVGVRSRLKVSHPRNRLRAPRRFRL